MTHMAGWEMLKKGEERYKTHHGFGFNTYSILLNINRIFLLLFISKYLHARCFCFCLIVLLGIIAKSTDSEARVLGFKYWFCYLKVIVTLGKLLSLSRFNSNWTLAIKTVTVVKKCTEYSATQSYLCNYCQIWWIS